MPSTRCKKAKELVEPLPKAEAPPEPHVRCALQSTLAEQHSVLGTVCSRLKVDLRRSAEIPLLLGTGSVHLHDVVHIRSCVEADVAMQWSPVYVNELPRSADNSPRRSLSTRNADAEILTLLQRGTSESVSYGEMKVRVSIAGHLGLSNEVHGEQVLVRAQVCESLSAARRPVHLTLIR